MWQSQWRLPGGQDEKEHAHDKHVEVGGFEQLSSSTTSGVLPYNNQDLRYLWIMVWSGIEEVMDQHVERRSHLIEGEQGWIDVS